MHTSSLVLFAVVLIIALQTLPISGKTVKQTATTTTTTTTTTTLAPTSKIPVTVKTPVKAPAKVTKKKNAGKKSKKPKQSPWKVPDANQKKLFNDYKTILRTKLNARNLNISATYQLEPVKYGSQESDKTSTLHHYLVKLPDGKYAHAIIGANKDAKKSTPASENNASIRRTIYDNLAAAEA